MANSLILNIPHSSTFIPLDDLDNVFHIPHNSFISKDEMIKKELLVMTDWFTDELFDHGIGEPIVANVSRLVCDTERFSHDESEIMASRGMGFCYENGSEKQSIKEVSSTYKDEILWRYYAPHHIALTDAVQNALNKSGGCVILDCHSFSNKPLPYEDEQDNDRPDICIGTDDYHTPEHLFSKVEKFFRIRGFRVAVNYPYGGTIVPLRYYRKDKRVMSVMIEVNRALYLKKNSSVKNRNFEKVQKILFDLEVMLRLMTLE